MACRILERSIGDGGLVSPHAIGVKKKRANPNIRKKNNLLCPHIRGYYDFRCNLVMLLLLLQVDDDD
jgi:hypothetical protein